MLNLKGTHRMGDGPIVVKTSAPHSLMTTYPMNLLSARSITLDSTLKGIFAFIRTAWQIL
jgi:hypothetical protein